MAVAGAEREGSAVFDPGRDRISTPWRPFGQKYIAQRPDGFELQRIAGSSTN